MSAYSWPGTDNIATQTNLSKSPNLSILPAKCGANHGANYVNDLKSKPFISSQPTVKSDTGELNNPGAKSNPIGAPLEHQPGRDKLEGHSNSHLDELTGNCV